MPNFIKFDLDEKIIKVLQEIGYKDPTPIQEQAIPKILEGIDIIASAQTGTGKTAAFMLPILHLLCQPSYKGSAGPQILILVPTRELAIQVADQAKKFSKHLSKIKTVCIYGGVPYPLQRKALACRYEILVATPGRLMDHMEQGRVDLSTVKMLVLDEADRMLDMGFSGAVEHIASATPKNRQTLMFSATIDNKILPYSKKLQNNPCKIHVETAKTEQNIEQRLYYVDNVTHKMRILEHILETADINQAIIFTSTIRQANGLADHLHEKGFLSQALHGDMNQRQRTRTIDKLRCGHIRFLIATDVAGRGIDISTLSHVVNFDMPFQPEDFVHRIGRTGRAGAKGIAITFATYTEAHKVNQINKLMGKNIELHTVEGLEPKARDDSNSGRRPPQRPRGRFGNSASQKRKSNDAPAKASGERKRYPPPFASKSNRPSRPSPSRSR